MTTYLDVAQVAARLGVGPSTVRGYLSREQMPPPDITLGRSPGWLPETIDAWVASRPGRGVGGGRPPAEERREGRLGDMSTNKTEMTPPCITCGGTGVLMDPSSAGAAIDCPDCIGGSGRDDFQAKRGALP